MNSRNWKSVRTGVKQVRAMLVRGEVNDAEHHLLSLDKELSSTRTQQQIDYEIGQLEASFAGFGGSEHAFMHCQLIFDRKWFEEEPDSDFKVALVAFLVKRWPNRNALWDGLWSKKSDTLHLL